MNRFEPLKSDWDLIVVGAGPAGALTSLLAARGGLRVLMVEKRRFPREKVCGGCLNGPALAVLGRCGLIERLGSLGGTWINRFQLLSPRRRLEVPLSGGVAVSRSRFDQMLVEASVESGVTFLDGVNASVLESTTSESTCRSVELRFGADDRRILNARVVVAADGLGHPGLSRLPQYESRIHPASYLGLAARSGVMPEPGFPPPGTVCMAVGQVGYVGMVRDETASVHLAAAVSPARLRQSHSAAACVERLVADSGTTLGIDFAALSWLGTGPITQTSSRVAGRRLFLLGDAAGYIEPFTGEGIAWALDSAERLAPLLQQGCVEWSDSLIPIWAKEISTQVRWPCRILTEALRHPRIFAAAAWLASQFAGLATAAAGLLDPEPETTRRLAVFFRAASGVGASKTGPDSPATKDAA